MSTRLVQSPLRRSLIRQDKILREELTRMVEETAVDMRRFFEQQTENWRNPPRFVVRYEVTSGRISATVEPDKRTKGGKIFNWLDRGTGKWGPNRRPYRIAAKRSPWLTFRTGYDALTQPVGKWNVGSGKAAGPWVRKKSVLHPGIKSRKFLQSFERKLKPPLDKRIENAFRRAKRRMQTEA